MDNEKSVEQLQKEHRCFSRRASPCVFFGFDSDKELENKIYDFIDKEGSLWDSDMDAWDPIIDFFKKEKINNVSFQGATGLIFHKMF